ncbi:glycosyltransferase family 4 protein [Flavobacterium ovatum]|uniref:glycosyltransferase family 4 protein n=1 Tax=Flavobacterium ovatum TaxID=1928857 RepID=UPI00344C9277
MKILILSHKFSPDIGGIESISKMFAEEFVKAGHEVRIVTHSLDTENQKGSYLVFRQPKTKTLFKQFIWADVVLENNPCMRLAWPLFFVRRPKVTGLQTWITSADGSTGITHHIKRYYLNFSSSVTACSYSLRQKTFYKALVIGNPYQHELFKIKKEIIRDKQFVFLGRLVSDKGADLAIKALSIINNSNRTSYSLSIIGSGEEEIKLKKLVKILNLENIVTFFGSMQGEALVNTLNRHEFLLVPSVWEEPFGIVALEGMACGCLPIVSDGGGLPDAVGKAGMIFKRGDVDDMVKKMLKLLKDPLLTATLRNEMPKHLTLHTSEIVASKYLQLLKIAFERK